MKLSDYIAHFLAKQGIKHVFAITGGASVHLIDSLSKAPDIDYICPQHEQAGAMMADAYSRVTGNLGAAVSTSGPGATNMLTGVCCSFYDSVPAIYITGQVSTFRMKGDLGIRQLGFQETDTVDIFKPITKYAVLVKDVQDVRYELEKAIHIAKAGRPGPVVVDIPDNLQREDINPDELRAFTPETESVKASLKEKARQCIGLINQAKRPVIILGWGIRLAKAEEEALKFIEACNFPVLVSFAMRDFLPASHPLIVGPFGSHGTRYGNFVVQNSDLVIALGSRLDVRKSGSPPEHFARGAKKIIVDIDSFELDKFKSLGIKTNIKIQADCQDFLSTINKDSSEISPLNISEWQKKIEDWKEQFPICEPSFFKEKELNPYVFVKKLSEELQEDDIIVSDTGCGLVWMTQGFEFKKGQRFFHAFNTTPMGYALPASIGACFASAGRRVICITGDGGLQMNIQELATVIRHQLPIKIFLINNHGYSMIMQTQDQWLDSKYEAANVDRGLAFPDFTKVANAYGFKTTTLDKNEKITTVLKETLKNDGPVFCNVEFEPDCRVVPQVKSGRPLEDAEPLLPRKEFFKNMIVEPIEVSRREE